MHEAHAKLDRIKCYWAKRSRIVRKSERGSFITVADSIEALVCAANPV